jgi:hypothetical protein
VLSSFSGFEMSEREDEYEYDALIGGTSHFRALEDALQGLQDFGFHGPDRHGYNRMTDLRGMWTEFVQDAAVFTGDFRVVSHRRGLAGKRARRGV